MLLRQLGLILLGIGAGVGGVPAEDSLDQNYANELPRIAPLEPENAVNTFEVHPDFEVQLVAAEPLVHDPIAMAFDERGRLFVVEMRGYSERRDDLRGAVRLLTDTDGDGVYDTSDIYVDGLAWPTAVACYNGGIFVGEPPNIFYCKDTTGDNRADVKELWYTGFSLANVQGMLNTFLWGLDNRIYASTSSNGAEVGRTDQPEAPPLSLRGRDFSFDPRTHELRAESGGGQHGMTFDEAGRRFVCHNSDHIQQILYDDWRTAHIPYMTWPGARRSIASDGAAAEVFRISPVEPWRELRTRLRVQGLVPGPIEGGGRAAGYFTSATGITVYKGDAWPPEYKGNVFIADVGSNLIHQKYIEESGIELRAHRADPGTEFVRSSDIWFRPVQFANAPDGTLFVADMYREIIEHPDSLPPIIKKHLDLNSGEDRGRIYRIVPKGFKQPQIPDIGKASTEALVAYLDHPNAWHRETAARLIYERQDKGAVPAIQKLLHNKPSPLGHVHALYALDGLGALQIGHLKHATDSTSPLLLVHAVRLVEKMLGTLPKKAEEERAILSRLLESTASSDNIHVRYETAFALAQAAPPHREQALRTLIQRDIADSWMRFAISSASLSDAPELLDFMLGQAADKISPSAKDFMGNLAYFTGITGAPATLAALGKRFADNSVPDADWLTQRLFDGLKLRGDGAPYTKTLQETGMLENMLAAARNTAGDPGTTVEMRVEALATLGLDTPESALPLLQKVLQEPQAPNTVRAQALRTLGNFGGAQVANTILEAWSNLTPAQRTQAVELLFAREDRIGVLLSSIEAGDFDPRALDANRRNTLLKHADPKIRRLAEKLLTVPTGNRDGVVARYMPALEMRGNPENGRRIFMEQCAQCHRFGGEGYEVGPDLATMAQAGAEKILVNVLDPNREINPQYLNYTIDTLDFESHTGIIVEESAASVTLRRAGGEGGSIPRSSIDRISSSEMSIMPEGLEESISVEEMADLIAYIIGGASQ